MKNYIIGIFDIEFIIFDYLNYKDYSSLAVLNSYYGNLLKKYNLYNEFKSLRKKNKKQIQYCHALQLGLLDFFTKFYKGDKHIGKYLIMCSARGYFNTVKWFFEKKFNYQTSIKLRSYITMAFKWACYNNHDEIAKYLATKDYIFLANNSCEKFMEYVCFTFKHDSIIFLCEHTRKLTRTMTVNIINNICKERDHKFFNWFINFLNNVCKYSNDSVKQAIYTIVLYVTCFYNELDFAKRICNSYIFNKNILVYIAHTLDEEVNDNLTCTSDWNPDKDIGNFVSRVNRTLHPYRMVSGVPTTQDIHQPIIDHTNLDKKNSDLMVDWLVSKIFE